MTYRGYGQHEDDTGASASEDDDSGPLSHMPLFLALLPLFLVISVNALFTYLLFPRMDMSFITERFPDIVPDKVIGLWALIIALAAASATLVVSRLGHWRNLRETVNKGVFVFMQPVFVLN